MEQDVPPPDELILELIAREGGQVDPETLINALLEEHEMNNVIEALQRAMERGKISLDPRGMVVSAERVAQAA